jgi:hypothetical protein
VCVFLSQTRLHAYGVCAAAVQNVGIVLYELVTGPLARSQSLPVAKMRSTISLARFMIGEPHSALISNMLEPSADSRLELASVRLFLHQYATLEPALVTASSSTLPAAQAARSLQDVIQSTLRTDRGRAVAATKGSVVLEVVFEPAHTNDSDQRSPWFLYRELGRVLQNAELMRLLLPSFGLVSYELPAFAEDTYVPTSPRRLRIAGPKRAVRVCMS